MKAFGVFLAYIKISIAAKEVFKDHVLEEKKDRVMILRTSLETS